MGMDWEQPPLVLVADDDESTRQLLAKWLAEFGYRVATASDGSEALTRIAKEDIRLAVLDLMMPGMSGFQVFMQIKEETGTRSIPVIVVTGLDIDEDQILATGIDGVFKKPVDKTKLQVMVTSLLQSTGCRVSS